MFCTLAVFRKIDLFKFYWRAIEFFQRKIKSVLCVDRWSCYSWRPVVRLTPSSVISTSHWFDNMRDCKGSCFCFFLRDLYFQMENVFMFYGSSCLDDFSWWLLVKLRSPSAQFFTNCLVDGLRLKDCVLVNSFPLLISKSTLLQFLCYLGMFCTDQFAHTVPDLFRLQYLIPFWEADAAWF